MSGSNGGYGGGRAEAPCQRLTFETFLNSPQIKVISSIKVREVLEIALQEIRGVDVVVALYGGEQAGAITSHTAQLIKCIKEGVVYEAEVSVASPPRIEITVRPK